MTWLWVVFAVVLLLVIVLVVLLATGTFACGKAAAAPLPPSPGDADRRPSRARVRKPKRITALLVATGKYRSFVQDVLSGLQRHAFRGHDLDVLLFTDDTDAFHDIDGLRPVYIPRKGFPGDTLYRFHYFLKEEAYLRTRDFVFYVDVDSWIVADIGEDVIPPHGGITAVRHLHQLTSEWSSVQKGSPETDPASAAYINPQEVMHGYYAGGFQGGTANEFMDAAKTIAAAIDTDDANGIMAKWHDESHWNRYLHEHIPAVSLSQSFVYPESCMPYAIDACKERKLAEPATACSDTCYFQGLDSIPPVVIARDKQHDEIRS